MRYRDIVRCLVFALGTVIFSTANAGDMTARFEELRSKDLRLAKVGGSLIEANSAQCRLTMPYTGLVLHSRNQYKRRDTGSVTAAFRFSGPVAIMSVVPASPAAVAGVRADDELVSVNGMRIDQLLSAKPARDREPDHAAVERWLSNAPADRILVLEINRDGQILELTLLPRTACRVRFEVAVGSRVPAQADDSVIQISDDFLDQFGDDGLKVMVAHELGHIVLDHHYRLIRLRMERNSGKRSPSLILAIRDAEDEADKRSVHLLKNAGFDPGLAIDFWRGEGRVFDNRLFLMRTHRSSAERAQLIEREISLMDHR